MPMHVPQITKIEFTSPTPMGEFVRVELDGAHSIIVTREQLRDFWQFSEIVEACTSLSFEEMRNCVPREKIEADWRTGIEHAIQGVDSQN